MKYPRVDDVTSIVDIVSDIRSIRGERSVYTSTSAFATGTGNAGEPRRVIGVPSTDAFTRNPPHDSAPVREQKGMSGSQPVWLPADMLMSPLENIGSIGRRYSLFYSPISWLQRPFNVIIIITIIVAVVVVY
jgi:hypothetical protein